MHLRERTSEAGPVEPDDGRAPLHLTSVGKLFLAADDPRNVRAYATRTGLAGHTRNSLTDLPTLERELAAVRRHAVARDNEELELGVRCMAAGVYDDQGKLVAGLSISAPADRLDEGVKFERLDDVRVHAEFVAPDQILFLARQ